jgi:hypothetical protein
VSCDKQTEEVRLFLHNSESGQRIEIMIRKITAKFMLVAAVAAMATGSALAEEPHHQHHKLAQDVDAFHAVLAPVWHARPGPERLQNACAKVDDMARLAGDIRSTDAAQLVAAIASLRTSCQGKQGNVDGALNDVHEAFHRLIDAKPASAKR